MKRQHPNNPDLFWCPKCESYKHKTEYRNSKRNCHGIGSYCRDCISIPAHKIICSMCCNEFLKTYGGNAKVCDLCRPKYMAERTKIWQKNNPEKNIRNKRMAEKRSIDRLSEHYVIKLAKCDGLVITAESIELKRQQIIMKRTLKEFKQWRKEIVSDVDENQ